MKLHAAKSPTQAIRTRLARLQQSTTSRSMARQVADLLPDIEAAIKAGVSYAAISESLVQSGVAVSANTLKVYLYRLRQATAPTAASSALSAPTPRRRAEPVTRAKPAPRK